MLQRARGQEGGRSSPGPPTPPTPGSKKSPKSPKSGGKASETAAPSGKGGGQGKAKSKKGSEKHGEQAELQMIASAVLLEQASELEQRAQTLADSADSVKTSTFERRLGAALLVKTAGKPLADVIREWDKNGDGQISKKEFRQAVVALGFEVPRAEVDALFEMFDKDGSNSIDAPAAEDAAVAEAIPVLRAPPRPAAPAGGCLTGMFLLLCPRHM